MKSTGITRVDRKSARGRPINLRHTMRLLIISLAILTGFLDGHWQAAGHPGGDEQEFLGSSQHNSTFGDKTHPPSSSQFASVASQILHNSDINAAIAQFEAAAAEKRAEPPAKIGDGNLAQEASHQSNNDSGSPQAGKRPIVQAKRTLVRSRYRLRAHKDTTGQQQQQVVVPAASPSSGAVSNGASSTVSNYSQPFDQAQGRSPDGGEQQGYQQLGRALGYSAQVGASSQDSPAPYTYLTTGSAQRVSSSAYSAGDGTAGLVLEAEPAPVVHHQSSPYNQAADSQLDGYAQQQHQSLVGYPASSVAQLAATARMYPTTAATNSASALGQHNGRLRAPPSSVAADSPYFLAAPSTNSASLGEYYGPGGADYFHDREHYSPSPAARNYSSDHSTVDYGNSNFGPPSAMYDYLGSSSPLASMSARSRWSWPWTDVSNYNTGNNINTAATFKKHHHHHHHHGLGLAHHKEHDYHHHHQHEEHEHLMSPKWEHGISIGEIACIAVAVVLGVIILGSPFFLLFLMLFNGGNLFGATQMGLLAPAIPGGATTATGKRRRRRSVTQSNHKADGVGNGGEQHGKLRASDLMRAGEYLFERLSPFMDSDKLMRSFERMMDVRDDIERIVAKITANTKQQQDHNSDNTQKPSNPETRSPQHIEMRRKK